MSKDKINFKNVKSVKIDMFSKESWLKIRKKKSDKRCSNCGISFLEVEESKLDVCSIPNSTIKVICRSCAKRMIEAGAKDIRAEEEKRKENKEKMIVRILELNNRYVRNGSNNQFWNYNLETLSDEELEQVYEDEEEKEKKKLELKEAIEKDFVPTETEEYLKKEYKVYEDEYLKHELQINDFFTEIGREFLKCGQGFAEDEKTIIVKIGNKFYRVTIHAEICSSKQNVGDRLYWVERIKKIVWAEIEKPQPKERKKYAFTGLLTNSQYREMEEHFKKLELDHLVIREID